MLESEFKRRLVRHLEDALRIYELNETHPDRERAIKEAEAILTLLKSERK